MEFIESGVPNLDLVLGGGLARGSLVMMTGAPGSGKTILSQQIAFHAARQGEQVLVLTTLSEPHAKLLTYLRTLSFFQEEVIGQRIELLNIYRQLREEFDTAGSIVLRLVRERRATLVVLDSFDSVRDLAPRYSNAREFIYELSAGLGLLGITVIVITASAPGLVPRYPEFAIADAVITLYQDLYGARSLRTLEMSKMRGAAQRGGRHSYQISAAGIQIYPRQETVLLPPETSPRPRQVSFGLPELDAMIAGGIPRGSNLLLIGSPGTGKTLLAAHFLQEGHRHGDPCLFVGFHEIARQLCDKVAWVHPGSEEVYGDRRSFVHRVPADLDADEVAAVIRDLVAERGITRLVVDGLDELLAGLVDSQRRLGYFAALMAYLRNAGVTTCFTQELNSHAGNLEPRTGTSFSAYTDAIIALRHIEYRGELHRVLAVVKLRGSAHDRALHEFTIDDEGLHVLAGGFEGNSDLIG